MGDFKVVYTGTYTGWIPFEFWYKDEKVEYEYTYCWGSPHSLLEWAEEIRDGKNIEFEYDCEGPYWYISYDGENVIISDDYDSYYDENEESTERKIRFKFKYDRLSLYKEIHDSFYKYINSKLYKPIAWEGFDVIEIILGKYKNYDDAISEVADLSLEELQQRISVHPYAYQLLPYLKRRRFCREYLNGDKKKRISMIDNYADTFTNFGSPLLCYRETE